MSVLLHTANGIAEGKRGRAATIQLRSLQASDVAVVVQPDGQGYRLNAVLNQVQPGKNVASVLFQEQEGSYLAGALVTPWLTDKLKFSDAQVRTVLSISHVAQRVEQIQLLTARGSELVYLDQAAPLIEEQNPRRLIAAERGVLDNQLAYIIYTPDAEGRLHGVAVDHASICNFVKVAAEVYGIPAEHRERRRALVLAVLVGEDSKHAVADLIGPGRTSGAWLSDGAATLPLPAVSQLNSRLLRYFVKRYTLKRGAIAFGKLLPVGIGAVVGGVGNRLMGKKIVANARKAFGNPPPRWPTSLHVLPAPPAPGER